MLMYSHLIAIIAFWELLVHELGFGETVEENWVSTQSWFVLIKFGLSEKHTKFEKNLPNGFDKLADLLNKG